MKIHVFRLRRGSDLKKEIIKYSRHNKIEAGCILTCVGCLKRATIRMPVTETTRDYEEQTEIVSMVGTISRNDVHLHLSIANKEGSVVGGHMKDNCIVDTTAEVVIGEFEDYSFTTAPDKETGYDELVIKKK